jgi:hypothetical protein
VALCKERADWRADRVMGHVDPAWGLRGLARGSAGGGGLAFRGDTQQRWSAKRLS